MFAKRKDCKATIGKRTMFGGKIFGNAREQGADGDIGNIGQGPTGFVRRVAVLDGLHINLELLVIGPAPRGIQPVLNHVFTRQACIQFGNHGFGIGQFLVESRHQHVIKYRSVAPDIFRHAWRCPGDLCQKFKQLRIGSEKRKQLHPGRKTFEEIIKGPKGHVGVGGFTKCRQKGRHQFCQDFTCPARPGRAIAAMMPATHRDRDVFGIFKAHFTQVFQRIGIIFGAGENKIARCSGKRHVIFKQFGIIVFDIAQMKQQVGLKGIKRLIPKEGRKGEQPLICIGQGLGLLIIDHLQAVFDRAQELIGRHHLVADFLGYLTEFGQGAQRVAGRLAAQRNLTSAPDQLLGLGKKLDLADTATAQFNVVAGDVDLAAALVGIDLALDGMNVLNGNEIKMLAPDKRAQNFKKLIARNAISTNDTGLDHGRAFPVLPDCFVIGFSRNHRQDRWR